jgi:heme-degrading monooxygenase HmoA
VLTVFSMWESRFPPENAAEGLRITEAIWTDMPCFAGYISHTLVRDLDDEGHLIVVSEWESREAADEVLRSYAGSTNARGAEALVSTPRRRTVGSAVSGR